MHKYKKIAILSPEAVYPANTGGRIVVFNKIKYLAKLGYKIALFCIVDNDKEGKLQNKVLKKMGIESFYYNRNKHKVHNLLGSIRLPYAVQSRNNISLRKKLSQLIKAKEVDLIDVEFPQMAANILNMSVIQKYGIKVILNQHNIEYLAMKSISQSFNNPIKRMIYKIEAIRLQGFEKKVYKSNLIDAYTFVSKDDLQIFKDNYINLGVPCEVFSIGSDDHSNNKIKMNQNIIIVGKMSYPPNAEGVKWFIKKVWPKITSKKPSAKLYVVGKDPDESLLKLKSENIIITGTVDSVQPYYTNSSVVAIPIFSGGGVKTKLIEAASYKMPIVTTPLGVLGTNFKNNEHVIVTEKPDKFAQAIIWALDQKDNMVTLANNAHKLFIKEYTWTGIVNKLSSFFDTI